MRVPSFLLIMLVMRSGCKVGREERVEVVVASYSGEMEALLRQAVRGGQQGLAVSLLLGEVSSLSRILQDPIHHCAELQAVAYPPDRGNRGKIETKSLRSLWTCCSQVWMLVIT